MKYLFAGGGTGGHIYPALSIAAALSRQDPAAQFLFVGTGHGLEATLVPRAGYELRQIHLYGFERRISVRNLQNLLWLTRSLWQVRRMIKDFAPDAAIGTGGYVCGPVLLQAALMGIPSLIQEQNALPGMTNRFLARFVDKIALGYAEAASRFSVKPEKLAFTGNPVREDLLLPQRDEACKFFGLNPELPVVLITGGSQGARSINEAALTLHRRFAAENSPVQLLHITGQTDYNNIIHSLQNEGIGGRTENESRVLIPYVHEMPQALAAADLVISRAGAIGLAELSTRRLPAILVPYPYAAENHQEVNARTLEQKGAAVVIRDSELNGEILMSTVQRLLADRSGLASMAAAAAAFASVDSAGRIASLVRDLAVRNEISHC